jgi:hypothetical protein
MSMMSPRDVHNVGNEEETDQEEADKDPIHFALREREGVGPRGYL